jgi:hypothetical protein
MKTNFKIILLPLLFCASMHSPLMSLKINRSLEEIYSENHVGFLSHKFVEQPLSMQNKIILAAGAILGFSPGIMRAKNTDTHKSALPVYAASAVAGIAIPIIVYQIYLKQKIVQETLREFLDHWNYYKPLTPKELHKKFDDLYKKYEGGENWKGIKKRAPKINTEIRSFISSRLIKR